MFFPSVLCNIKVDKPILDPVWHLHQEPLSQVCLVSFSGQAKPLFLSPDSWADEQKHYLYDHVFKALNASLGYEDFKKRLAEESIRVTEHVNSKGAYGISFYMENVENAHVFKGADLSRKLTYQNIQKHFDGVAVGLSPHIDRVGEFRERVDREAFYMQGGGVMAIPELDITGSGKKSQEDDLIPSKKKRKRKSGPDFSLWWILT